jgi:hypothetical protein
MYCTHVKFQSVVMRYTKSTVSLVVEGLMRAILSPQAPCLLPLRLLLIRVRLEMTRRKAAAGSGGHGIRHG